MKLGLAAFAILAVLTTVEYIIAINVEQNIIPILLIAQVKVGLILWFFMHIRKAITGQEHD
jgi:heme/copper-type cytochrome/quinol oxidase subunit 4